MYWIFVELIGHETFNKQHRCKTCMLRRTSPVLFTASDSSEEKRIVDKAISKSMLLCYLCINYNHRDFGVLVYICIWAFSYLNASLYSNFIGVIFCILRRMSPALFKSRKKYCRQGYFKKCVIMLLMCINYNHCDFGVLVYNFAYHMSFFLPQAFTVIW